MAGIVMLFLVVAIACMYVGIKLIKLGAKPVAEPLLPPARTANPEGVDRAYEKAARAANKAKGAGRGLQILSGVGLIAAPWVFVAWVLSSLGGGGYSKGRVLRIKNRAQLPEPALGDGWSGAAVTLCGTPTATERAVLGELWLLTARMEHASVAAFSQLALHLTALGAPARLLEATHRAALDEIRHARACFAIVHAITGERQSAGPIVALGAVTKASIDLTRLAIGTLVDGCLAEGIAADVAARSATLAEEPAIRATLAMIAGDEAGHAELAWEVLAWSVDEGGAPVAHAVSARVDVLDRELAPRLPGIPGVDDSTLAGHGVIDQHSLGEIAATRIAAVQARARRLVEARAPAHARAA